LCWIIGVGVLLLFQGLAAGQQVDELQAVIEAKRAEVAMLGQGLDQQRRAAETLQGELAQLQAMSDELERAKTEALEAMDAQYQRIIDDPGLDLAETQAAYRNAVAAQRRHEAAVEGKELEVARQQQQIDQANRDAEAANRQLAQLSRDLQAARVGRLQRELSLTDSIALTNVIACEGNETIAGCIARAEQEAREAAVKAFVDRLFASATESDLIAKQRDGIATEASLVDVRIEKSGFRGQGDYIVELTAEVSNSVSQQQACRLLSLDEGRCPSGEAVAESATATPAAADAREQPVVPRVSPSPADTVASAPDTPPTDVRTDGRGPYMLTVRSNVYYDEVFIDGVAYGSTRVDVMLPAGDYDIEVRKPGHTSYTERVRLDRAATVIAELAEQ
jgi:hypothetical protein